MSEEDQIKKITELEVKLTLNLKLIRDTDLDRLERCEHFGGQLDVKVDVMDGVG